MNNIKDEKMNMIKNNINTKNYKLWKHFLSTNCYAFALGLDIKEKDILKNAYQPGTISGINYSKFTKYFILSALEKGMYADMKNMGILIRKVEPYEEIDENEWKIALFVSQIFNNGIELLNDFHFLRQVQDGTWYHKRGYFGIPNNKDDNNKIITDPKDCYLKHRRFVQCYSLKLKK